MESEIMANPTVKEIFELIKVKHAERRELQQRIEHLDSELYALGQVVGIVAMSPKKEGT